MLKSEFFVDIVSATCRSKIKNFDNKILEIFYLTSLGIVNANIVGEFTASAVHKQIVVEESFQKILSFRFLKF